MRPAEPFDVSVLQVPQSVALSVQDAGFEMAEGNVSDDILRSYVAEWGDDLRLIVEWLIGYSTPYDRHVLANFNWDSGLHLFHWIISQPDTDVATALKIAWLAEPSYHIRALAAGQRSGQSGTGISSHDLLVQITQRVNAGFYLPRPEQSRLAFAPDRPATWDRDDPAIRRAEAKLLPPQALVPVKGREARPQLPDALNWDVLC